MQFTSLHFLFLLSAAVLFTRLFERQTKIRNLTLLGFSYLFYGWQLPQLILILGLISILCFAASKLMNEFDRTTTRKLILLGSIVLIVFVWASSMGLTNTGDFLWHAIGIPTSSLRRSELGLAPFGLAFVCLQALGFLIDQYRSPRDCNALSIALFLAFFPQLVAGPIERSTGLLASLGESKLVPLNESTKAFAHIIFGFFLKLVLADNISPLVNTYVIHVEQLGTISFLIVSVSKVCQIYADFLGYSYIAVGSGLLIGFRLMRNFNHPLTASNPIDFWLRWNTTFTSWVRSYVYSPLRDALCARLSHPWSTFIALVCGFFFVGLWHGATSGIFIWSFAQFILVAFYRFVLFRFESPLTQRYLPKLIRNVFYLLLFSIAGWFGYAETPKVAWQAITHLFNPNYQASSLPALATLVVLSSTIYSLDWMLFKMRKPKSQKLYLTWIVLGIVLISFLSSNQETPFTYVRFGEG